MKYLLLLAASFGAFANTNYDSAAAYAEGTVVNQNSYAPVILDGNTPNNRITKDSVSCATSKLDLGVTGAHHNAYSNSNSAAIMAVYSIPTDSIGGDSSCKQMERLLIRKAELERDHLERENTVQLLKDCIELNRQGIIVKPVGEFAWVKKCDSVTLYTTRGMEIDQRDDIRHHIEPVRETTVVIEN